jgi:hypothetical protein
MNEAIYVAMQGHSEFTIGGVLETWHCTDRLHNIKVPALVMAGEAGIETILLYEGVYK